MPFERTLPPVILVGAGENGLSILRSLGPSGVRVHALGCSDLVRRSRFVRWTPGVSDLKGAAEWRGWLLGEESSPLAGAVLIPGNDEAVVLLATERAALGERYRLGETGDRTALRLLDKGETHRMALQAGVPVPRTAEVRSSAELEALLPELRFPCALKPRHSHLWQAHYREKLLVVADAREAMERFAQIDRLGLEIVVTEIVTGADDQHFSYWTYVTEDGRNLFRFTKQKRRQYPVHWGMGTYHTTVDAPEAAELGERFVRGTGLRGMAIVEFRRDARDGRLRLMECNVRFPRAADIAVRSGIDLPLLVYNHLTGRPLPVETRFRTGVSLWFPLNDWRAFRAYRKRGELTFRAWARTLLPWPQVAAFRWFDPLPALGELATWAGRGSDGRRSVNARSRRQPLREEPEGGRAS